MIRYSLALAQVMRDVRRPRAQVEALAARRLKNILVSAYRSVPYYRKVMRESGFDPRDSRNVLDDLSRLPLLTKKVIKEHKASDFIAEECQPMLSRCFKDVTSGSTGVPLTVYRDKRERAVQVAKWLRVLLLNGYSPRHKVLSFTAPTRIDGRTHVLQRLGLFRHLALDNSVAPKRHVDTVLAYQPHLIYGVRSVLELVALELRRRSARLHPETLVIVGGEVVHDGARRLLRERLGDRIVEMYGTVETGIMACERPDGPGMWLCDDLTHFEFLNDDGEYARAGESARVVVTDLTGRVMPFIRYVPGDYVVYEEERTPEGRRVRTLRKVIGRDSDYVVLGDGTKQTYNVFHAALQGFDGIRQYRVVQKRLDYFQIQLVSDGAYLDEISGELTRRLRAAFPSQASFDLAPVDEIEPDTSGKIRMLISEVDG